MSGRTELTHIMTDLTGEFNRVVMLSQYENLTAYEQNFQSYMTDSEEMWTMKEKMKGYTDMYISGTREIFHAW